MMYYGWIWMLFPGLLSVSLFVLLIVLVVRMVAGPRHGQQYRSGANEESSGKPNNRALEILAERYAKGEISDEEYRHMKENLGS